MSVGATDSSDELFAFRLKFRDPGLEQNGAGMASVLSVLPDVSAFGAGMSFRIGHVRPHGLSYRDRGDRSLSGPR